MGIDENTELSSSVGIVNLFQGIRRFIFKERDEYVQKFEEEKQRTLVGT